MNYNKSLEKAIDNLVLDLKSSTGLSEFISSQEQYKKSLWYKIDEIITSKVLLKGCELYNKVENKEISSKQAINEYCEEYKTNFMIEFHKEVQKRKFNWNY